MANIEVNPRDYTNCFSAISNTNASFKVNVYVLEPVPGVNLHYGINGVGHVAIGLTKTGNNGQSITQVLGFYPEGVNIFKQFSGASMVVDNGWSEELMNYTVRMEFNMGNDATNFQRILNKVNNPPTEYHAFYNNCVRYVLDACAAGGLEVPFAMSSITVDMEPATPGPLTTIYAYTPAGMAQEMRQRKAAGDNRVTIANYVNVTPSNGPCN